MERGSVCNVCGSVVELRKQRKGLETRKMERKEEYKRMQRHKEAECTRSSLCGGDASLHGHSSQPKRSSQRTVAHLPTTMALLASSILTFVSVCSPVSVHLLCVSFNLLSRHIPPTTYFCFSFCSVSLSPSVSPLRPSISHWLSLTHSSKAGPPWAQSPTDLCAKASARSP